MPIEIPTDETKRISVKLLGAFRKLQDQNRQYPGRHTTALEALSRIFKGQADTLPDYSTAVLHQTSTIKKIPEATQQAPRVHSKITQAQTLKRIYEGEKMPTSEGVEQPTSKGA